MLCPGKLQKMAAIQVFETCLAGRRHHLPVQCQVSLTVRTHYASLTCLCGAGCILAFSAEMMGELSELQSRTVTPQSVRGLIARGILLTLSMPFGRSMMAAQNAGALADIWASVQQENHAYTLWLLTDLASLT